LKWLDVHLAKRETGVFLYSKHNMIRFDLANEKKAVRRHQARSGPAESGGANTEGTIKLR
jgi:hypothetical protein